jgi:hypothetical protein
LAKVSGYTKLEWEYLEEKKSESFYYYIRRAAVLGGWIVESSKYTFDVDYKFLTGVTSGAGYGVGLTFIPDPEHKWQGLEVIKESK